MKQLALQKKNGAYYPYSEEDKEASEEFENNQIVNAKITGVQKPRSYEQLKLFWILCKIVSENNEDPDWDSKSKVSEQIKIKTGHVDYYFEAKPGFWIIKTKSISYSDLKHLKACKFFEKAIAEMAKFLDVSVDDLLIMGNERL